MVTHRKSRIVTNTAIGYERLNDATERCRSFGSTLKPATFEEQTVAAETSFARL